jgi:hypothetical protein
MTQLQEELAAAVSGCSVEYSDADLSALIKVIEEENSFVASNAHDISVCKGGLVQTLESVLVATKLLKDCKVSAQSSEEFIRSTGRVKELDAAMGALPGPNTELGSGYVVTLLRAEADSVKTTFKNRLKNLLRQCIQIDSHCIRVVKSLNGLNDDDNDDAEITSSSATTSVGKAAAAAAAATAEVSSLVEIWAGVVAVSSSSSDGRAFVYSCVDETVRALQEAVINPLLLQHIDESSGSGGNSGAGTWTCSSQSSRHGALLNLAMVPHKTSNGNDSEKSTTTTAATAAAAILFEARLDALTSLLIFSLSEIFPVIARGAGAGAGAEAGIVTDRACSGLFSTIHGKEGKNSFSSSLLGVLRAQLLAVLALEVNEGKGRPRVESAAAAAAAGASGGDVHARTQGDGDALLTKCRRIEALAFSDSMTRCSSGHSEQLPLLTGLWSSSLPSAVAELHHQQVLSLAQSLHGTGIGTGAAPFAAKNKNESPLHCVAISSCTNGTASGSDGLAQDYRQLVEKGILMPADAVGSVGGALGAFSPSYSHVKHEHDHASIGDHNKQQPKEGCEVSVGVMCMAQLLLGTLQAGLRALRQHEANGFLADEVTKARERYRSAATDCVALFLSMRRGTNSSSGTYSVKQGAVLYNDYLYLARVCSTGIVTTLRWYEQQQQQQQQQQGVMHAMELASGLASVAPTLYREAHNTLHGVLIEQGLALRRLLRRVRLSVDDENVLQGVISPHAAAGADSGTDDGGGMGGGMGSGMDSELQQHVGELGYPRRPVAPAERFPRPPASTSTSEGGVVINPGGGGLNGGLYSLAESLGALDSSSTSSAYSNGSGGGSNATKSVTGLGIRRGLAGLWQRLEHRPRHARDGDGEEEDDDPPSSFNNVIAARALSQHLELVAQQWSGTMPPSVLASSIGELAEGVATEVLSRVLSAPCIGEGSIEGLVAVLGNLRSCEDRLDTLLLPSLHAVHSHPVHVGDGGGGGGGSGGSHYPPSGGIGGSNYPPGGGGGGGRLADFSTSWPKLAALGRFLDCPSLTAVAEGLSQRDFAAFSSIEVSALVCSVFEDSPKRAAVVRNIHDLVSDEGGG